MKATLFDQWSAWLRSHAALTGTDIIDAHAAHVLTLSDAEREVLDRHSAAVAFRARQAARAAREG